MIWADLDVKDIGKDVLYLAGTDREEKGKIKGFDNESRNAFVVFHCGDDWDNFMNYTGQSTKYKDLEIIINQDDCDHDYADASYKWGNPNRQRCIICGKVIND